MRRIFQVFGSLLLLGYSWAAFTGGRADRKHETLPAGARNAGGYRT